MQNSIKLAMHVLHIAELQENSNSRKQQRTVVAQNGTERIITHRLYARLTPEILAAAKTVAAIKRDTKRPNGDKPASLCAIDMVNKRAIFDLDSNAIQNMADAALVDVEDLRTVSPESVFTVNVDIRNIGEPVMDVRTNKQRIEDGQPQTYQQGHAALSNHSLEPSAEVMEDYNRNQAIGRAFVKATAKTKTRKALPNFGVIGEDPINTEVFKFRPQGDTESLAAYNEKLEDAKADWEAKHTEV